ncbi:MAG: DUF2808 domain-containing protein [Pseudanabaenaceae cyanobacterium bins.68]|nr:DUF2808 domain-containing protein [Pseudanabaenaceae cyanobacterium bins.68]
MKRISLLSLGFSLFAFATAIHSQNNIVIFGPNQDSTLAYVIRTPRPGARANSFSFSLNLPAAKAVAELLIYYPEGFGQVFNPENISITNRRTDKTEEISQAIVDRELRTVRYVFKQPIPGYPGQTLEINASGVTNPSKSGMYRIEARALGTEANPLFQYLGQWLVTIY